MNDYRREEYKALRATIRSRGSVRTITFLASILAWAAVVLLLHLGGGVRDTYGTFISLMVLVAGFEAVFQIHVGVERVGRYLQVFYEPPPPARVPEVRSAESEPGPPYSAPNAVAEQAPAKGDGIQMWETVAMAYGKAYPPIGSGSLFSGVYLLAALFNALPVLRAVQDPPVFAGVVTAHLVFVLRVRIAVRQAAAQRAEDLERFHELRAAGWVGQSSSSSGDSPSSSGATRSASGPSAS